MIKPEDLIRIGIGNISAREELAKKGISIDDLLYGSAETSELGILNFIHFLKKYEPVLLTQSGKLLDLFCGKGYFLAGFKELNPQWKTYGVDGHPEVVSEAIQNFPQTRFQIQYCPPLPYDAEFFNVVHASKVMDYADTRKTLVNPFPQTFILEDLTKEVHRTLKKEGLYFIDSDLTEREKEIIISTGLEYQCRHNREFFVKRH